MCNRTLPTCVLGVEARNLSIHVTTFSRGHSPLRDWSLITGRGGGGGGGATKRQGGGGHVKFYPYEKGGGAAKVLAMLKP